MSSAVRVSAGGCSPPLPELVRCRSSSLAKAAGGARDGAVAQSVTNPRKYVQIMESGGEQGGAHEEGNLSLKRRVSPQRKNSGCCQMRWTSLNAACVCHVTP